MQLNKKNLLQFLKQQGACSGGMRVLHGKLRKDAVQKRGLRRIFEEMKAKDDIGRSGFSHRDYAEWVAGEIVNHEFMAGRGPWSDEQEASSFDDIKAAFEKLSKKGDI